MQQRIPAQLIDQPAQTAVVGQFIHVVLASSSPRHRISRRVTLTRTVAVVGVLPQEVLGNGEEKRNSEGRIDC